MNFIKITKNKIELKKLKEEEMYLEGVLINRSEAIAAVGDDYIEEEYEEVSKRYSEVIDRMEELRAISKRRFFK